MKTIYNFFDRNGVSRETSREYFYFLKKKYGFKTASVIENNVKIIYNL